MREKTVNILLVCCLAAVVNVAARNLEIIGDRMNDGGETVKQARGDRTFEPSLLKSAAL